MTRASVRDYTVLYLDRNRRRATVGGGNAVLGSGQHAIDGPEHTGALAIDALSDVDTTTTPPTDGQGLIWDDGLGLWLPGDPGVADHGALTGLADDDHPQYATNVEFDDHSARHQSGGADVIKLDDFGTPDDNTDLDATTGRHGLLMKLGGGSTNFLRADGTWASPGSGGGGSLTQDDFIGDGAEDTFTLSNEPGGAILVTVNGAQVLPGDYTLTGDQLVFDTAPANLDEILVTYITAGGGGLLDNLTDVDTSGVADGDVLTYDSGASEWIAAAPTGGPGGGSKYDPDNSTPSTTPDIAAEFDGGSLDAGWSWTSAPTAQDYTNYPGYMVLDHAAASGGALSAAWTPGAVDLTLACKVNYGYVPGNGSTHAFIFGFADGTGTPANFAGIYILSYASGGYDQFRLTTITRTGGGWTVGTESIIGIGPIPRWYRVTRTISDNTIRGYFSTDGITWHQYANVPTKAVTVSHASLLVDAQAAMRSTWDWIRGWDSIIEKVGA